MSKFVLFGSTNRTALHFIRHASASSLKILCLYPYETQDSDRHSLLISSLGGIPIRYNFRNTYPDVEGLHSHEGLKSILRGTKGVVWAAGPDGRETTLSRHEERFSDYLQDLRSTFAAIRELDHPRRFLLLTRHARHGVDGSGKDEEKWWRNYAIDNRSVASTDVEILESMMNMEGLKWTVVRVGRYLNDLQQQEEGGIELGAKASDGVRGDDVARTMVEILKVDGLSSMFLDIKSVPASEENGIENVIRKLAKPLNTQGKEFLKLSGSSQDTTNTLPAASRAISSLPAASSFSSADPILSTVNARNFPNQFSQLAQQDSIRMDQFLEGIREGRAANETRSLEEARQNEQLRQAREKARSEAMKRGLPPPGADIKMLRKLNSKKERRTTTTKQESTTNNIQSATATEIKQSLQSQPPARSQRDESRSVTVEVDHNSVVPAVTISGRTVFETLADVLLDRSADYLSPHLAAPIVSNDYGEDGYHPKWKFNRWKLKRPRNGRP